MERVKKQASRAGGGGWGRGVRLGWWLVLSGWVGVVGAEGAEGAEGGAGESAEAGGGGWVVATYNVENYNVVNRRIEVGFRRDYPKPEAEKAALRGVIRELGAEVLALQEVGGVAFLEELRRDLAREGVDYPYGWVLEGADEARKLAVLSRRPLLEVVDHVDLTLSWGEGRERVRRGMLEVTVAAGEGRLTVFVVHLKSRLTEQADDPMAAAQRAAEAVAVRDRILERQPDPQTGWFVVAGDFNDHPGSRPLRAIMDRGRTPISRPVEAADSRGHRWTHHYARQSSYSRVDHVLVSPALVGRVREAWVADGPGVDEASDHRPVAVRVGFGGE